jgi:hypothetical protein|eukprot:Stramenopile-MAST_4_protein_1818
MRRQSKPPPVSTDGAQVTGFTMAEKVVLERKVTTLEERIVILETENRVLKGELEASAKRHEEALYQTAVTNRENHLQLERFQKLTLENSSLDKERQKLEDTVRSIEESSNVLRAAHERLFIDYKKVAHNHDLRVSENETLKTESAELKRQVDNLNRFKDKFVATNKEIVKLYRENQRHQHINKDMSEHFAQVETGYTIVFDELHKRLADRQHDLQFLYNKYKDTKSKAERVVGVLEKQGNVVKVIQEKCKQVRKGAIFHKIENEGRMKEIEDMNNMLESYITQVTAATEEQELVHQRKLQDQRMSYEKQLEKVRWELNMERNIIDDRWKKRLQIIDEQYAAIVSALKKTTSKQTAEIALLKENNVHLGQIVLGLKRETRKLKKKRNIVGNLGNDDDSRDLFGIVELDNSSSRGDENALKSWTKNRLPQTRSGSTLLSASLLHLK